MLHEGVVESEEDDTESTLFVWNLGIGACGQRKDLALVYEGGQQVNSSGHITAKWPRRSRFVRRCRTT